MVNDLTFTRPEGWVRWLVRIPEQVLRGRLCVMGLSEALLFRDPWPESKVQVWSHTEAAYSWVTLGPLAEISGVDRLYHIYHTCLGCGLQGIDLRHEPEMGSLCNACWAQELNGFSFSREATVVSSIL